jgi:hypothetical protein
VRRSAQARGEGADRATSARAFLAALALTLLGSGLFAGSAVAAPPVTSTDPSPTASYVTAQVSGTVDPKGSLVYWSFETSTDGEHWSGFTFEGLTGEGQPAEAVSAELHGLSPNTHYFVRLSAYNFNDPVVSSPEPYAEFTTLPVAKPVVLTTDDASEVSYTTAKASGSVERPSNPDPAFDVNCNFEYVTDAAFAATGFDGASQVPCAENPITASGPSAVHASLTGLATGTTYHLRLSASTAGGTTRKAAAHTFTTQTPAPPTVSIDDPVIDSPIAGHFSGDINPNGTDPVFDVKWHFECIPACPGLKGTIPADTSSHHISVDATLTPERVYEVTLVAENAGAQASAGPKTFSTEPGAAPVVVTGRANSPDGTTASVFGTVNPLGTPTTYYFEYGTTTGYGSRAPGEDGQAGAGFSPLPVGQDLTGLSAETTYHYRLVAVSSAGTVAGADRTFTTSPLSIPARAFELVSPAEKGGANLLRESEALASINGNAFSFAGQVALHDTGTETAPYFTHYVANRTSDGWATTPVDAAQLPTENPTNVFRLMIGVSRDNSKAIVVSRKALAPGAGEGDSNVYMRDTVTGALTTVVSVPGRAFYDEVLLSPCCFARTFGGATPNFDHVLLYSAYNSLLPGAPPGALYDFTGGELHLASVSPGGAPAQGTAAGQSDREANRISTDGSKIFFANPENGAVFVRIDGSTTQAITKSRKTGSVGKLKPGTFIGASSDGRVAYVISNDLTNDSPSEEANLYRYEVETDGLEMLTPLGSEAFGIQVSNDGGTVYFKSKRALAPGADEGTPNFFVWRDGVISTVAALHSEFDGRQSTEFGGWASPNGRYFAFRAMTPLTDYDTTAPGQCFPNQLGDGDRVHCAQVYRFDAETKTLTCASCPPDGQPAIGSPHTGIHIDEFANEQIPRIVTNSGQVFFDSPSRLVPGDSNGARDVYEYDGSNIRLISSGRGRAAELSGVGGEGRDVFILTADRLVKIDTDSALDLYDARVGGGFASQNQEPPVPPCKGEDCRGLPPVPPAPPPGGSETTFGPGSPKPARSKRCGKGRHAKKVHGKKRCVKNVKKQHDKRRQGR